MFFLFIYMGPYMRKIKATYYFIFYTILGSLLLLFAIIQIYLKYNPLDYLEIIYIKIIFIFEYKLFL